MLAMLSVIWACDGLRTHLSETSAKAILLKCLCASWKLIDLPNAVSLRDHSKHAVHKKFHFLSDLHCNLGDACSD